jgi:hypothetical protein
MAGCDYRVPVCRMPIGYRVPGLLRVDTRLETSGLKSMSDEDTVWRAARSDNESDKIR